MNLKWGSFRFHFIPLNWNPSFPKNGPDEAFPLAPYEERGFPQIFHSSALFFDWGQYVADDSHKHVTLTAIFREPEFCSKMTEENEQSCCRKWMDKVLNGGLKLAKLSSSWPFPAATLTFLVSSAAWWVRLRLNDNRGRSASMKRGSIQTRTSCKNWFYFIKIIRSSCHDPLNSWLFSVFRILLHNSS